VSARSQNGQRPGLQVLGNPTAEEVAAITAAVSALAARRGAVTVAETSDGKLDHWVEASRLPVRRSTLMRGNWRLSGRLGRRSRT
jgi:hypothetical protein